MVIGFDNPYGADRALPELVRLQKEYLIDLDDAVVATRSADGKVRLKQTHDLAAAGAASGGEPAPGHCPDHWSITGLMTISSAWPPPCNWTNRLCSS